MQENNCDSKPTYNFSNEVIAESILYKHIDRVNMLGVLPTIVVFGVLSNLVFLFTVFRLKRMQTVTNYYLASLAMCDLVLLATGPLVRIIAFAKSVGRLFELSILPSKYHCASLFALAAFAYYASLAVVSLVSTERFYALCFPLRHRAIAAKGRTVKLILGALVVCFIFASINSASLAGFRPFCVVWPKTAEYEDMPTTGSLCVPLTVNFYIYHNVFNVSMFMVLLVYNTVLYVIIVHALSKRNSFDDEKMSSEQVRIRNQVARVLILNGVVFFICQGPYRLFILNRVTNALFNVTIFTREQADNVETFGRILVYLNSAINPTLYALSSPFYRKAFIEAIGTCCVKKDTYASKSSVTMQSTVNTNYSDDVNNNI